MEDFETDKCKELIIIANSTNNIRNTQKVLTRESIASCIRKEILATLPLILGDILPNLSELVHETTLDITHFAESKLNDIRDSLSPHIYKEFEKIIDVEHFKLKATLLIRPSQSGKLGRSTLINGNMYYPDVFFDALKSSNGNGFRRVYEDIEQVVSNALSHRTTKLNKIDNLPKGFPFDLAFHVDKHYFNTDDDLITCIEIKTYKTDKISDIQNRYTQKKPRTTAQNSYNWNYLEENGIYPPTREALSFLMEAEGLDIRDVAELLDVNTKTVSGWLSRIGTKTAITMPNAYWELLLLKLKRHPRKKLVDS